MDNESGSRTTDRPLFQTAVLDHTTGQIARVDPDKRPQAMSLARLQQALEELKMIPMGGGGKTLTPYVTLSAQQPWVEGRGWLEAIAVRSFFASSPNMGWIPTQGQPQGYLDIWLEGLEPNALYVAQIEVSSMGTGMFEVQAVALGAGQFVANTQANGGYQSLISMFGTVDGGLAKIKVSNPDWVFLEVVVSQLE